MKTLSIKKDQIERDWYVVDASDQKLGRLASNVAQVIRGKHKPFYTPNLDMGDFVVIINADKIHLTGNKLNDKIYYKHTGHPGGLKATNAAKLKLKNKSTDLIKLAIKRMIPKGPLGNQQLSNCKIFSGTDHNHQAQNPEALDISKLNNKNYAR